jgi:oligopeptide/dipeptide ABC transporter ATP-binding protein
VVLEINDLQVQFNTWKGVVHAVNDVSLTIRPGEVVGLIGESGSGKSVTARAVLGLVTASPGVTAGSIKLDGKEIRELSRRELAAIRGKRVALISQDPMSALNPVFTVGEHLVDTVLAKSAKSSRAATVAILDRYHSAARRRRRAARERAVELLDRVLVSRPRDRLDRYPHEMSGGMRQRIVIAQSWAQRPDLIIADEPTTALDVTVQAQILSLLSLLARRDHTSVLYISHDLAVISQLCDRVAVMYAGEIVEEATTAEIFSNPQHPYTRALLAATNLSSREDLGEIPGEVPNLLELPAGCYFSPRCPMASKECFVMRPAFKRLSGGHAHRCGVVHGEWLASR